MLIHRPHAASTSSSSSSSNPLRAGSRRRQRGLQQQNRGPTRRRNVAGSGSRGLSGRGLAPTCSGQAHLRPVRAATLAARTRAGAALRRGGPGRLAAFAGLGSPSRPQRGRRPTPCPPAGPPGAACCRRTRRRTAGSTGCRSRCPAGRVGRASRRCRAASGRTGRRRGGSRATGTRVVPVLGRRRDLLAGWSGLRIRSWSSLATRVRTTASSVGRAASRSRSVPRPARAPRPRHDGLGHPVLDQLPRVGIHGQAVAELHEAASAPRRPCVFGLRSAPPRGR